MSFLINKIILTDLTRYVDTITVNCNDCLVVNVTYKYHVKVREYESNRLHRTYIKIFDDEESANKFCESVTNLPEIAIMLSSIELLTCEN